MFRCGQEINLARERQPREVIEGADGIGVEAEFAKLPAVMGEKAHNGAQIVASFSACKRRKSASGNCCQ